MTSSKLSVLHFMFLLLTAQLTAILTAPQMARADFGEIDILVRESIENHFRESGRSVDLEKLTYLSEPKWNGAKMMIHTSVWAEQRLIRPHWGWHECTTVLEAKRPGVYEDQGSDCFFDFD
jgi:hypothetical protein